MAALKCSHFNLYKAIEERLQTTNKAVHCTAYLSFEFRFRGAKGFL